MTSNTAERARTILARATSAEVCGEQSRAWASRQLVLSPDPFEPDEPCSPVQVEVADAAPLPVRERIRGRVRITGVALGESGCRALHVHPTGIELVEGRVVEQVDPVELLAAEPDPLLEVEASMLAHLDSSHADVLETLTRLVDARLRQGVVRVWPYRLDRHGLVLRLEHASGHVDSRLSFDRPVEGPQEVQAAMGMLIARARHAASCPPASRVLASALRAGAAARRLCSPRLDD